MKDPLLLVSEFSYRDENTHIFRECRIIKKPYEMKILGLYGQRLDSCNLKFRFAAKSYLKCLSVLHDLEQGEFIYFDDKSRLKMSFYLESLLIFLRASLDLAISSYYIYFTGKTNLDSLNDFLKSVEKFVTWIPNESKEYWRNLNAQYLSPENEWVLALAGTDKGMSLRDIAVHKSNIEMETGIDENDKGHLYIKVKCSEVPAKEMIDILYHKVQGALNLIKKDILDAEKLLI